MTWSDYLTLLPFAVLAFAALPVTWARRAALTALHRGGWLTALTGVAACGLFAVRPEFAPEPLRDWLAGTAPADAPAVAWLLKAALLLAVALPVCAHLDYARAVAFHSACLRALRRQLAAVAEEPTRPHVAAPTRGKLVKDLLDEAR